MLTSLTLKKLKIEQNKLDELIYQQSTIEFEWVSLWNVKRLKLALFTEVAEFANELRTFKIWRNKKEIDWLKTKTELIDCLCFFLGLCNIYQIDFTNYQIQYKELKLKGSKAGLEKDVKNEIATEFNNLLLKFFSQTEKLTIPKKEIVTDTKTKLTESQVNTYYNWLQTFNEIAQKLRMDETEVLTVYLKKVDFNQKRSKKGR